MRVSPTRGDGLHTSVCTLAAQLPWFSFVPFEKINPTCRFTRRQTPILSKKSSIQKFVQKGGCPTGSESSGCQAKPLDVSQRSDSKRRFKRKIVWHFSFEKMTRARFNGHQFWHQKSMFCGKVPRIYQEVECAPKLTKAHVCTAQSY